MFLRHNTMLIGLIVCGGMALLNKDALLGALAA